MQSQFLWDTYFSSTKKFVLTILEILKDRIYSHLSRSYTEWNFPPGAIYNQMADVNNNNNNNLFTAVIHIPDTINSVLLRNRISDLLKSVNLFELILVTKQIFRFKDSTKIKIISKTDLKYFKFQTNSILNLEFYNIPTPQDIEFGFYIWKQFPQRLVGYTPYSHLWDTNKEKWAFDNNNNNTKRFSTVSLSPAFIHKSYLSQFSKNIPNNIHFDSESVECELIGFNFYVSHLSKSPPILISATLDPSRPPFVLNATQLQYCMDLYIELYEYNPLIYSQINLAKIGI